MAAARVVFRRWTPVVARAARPPVTTARFASSTSAFVPREVTEQDAERAAAKDREMSERYDRIGVEDPAAALEARRKRLVYRAKQRGWLEVDLILGSWAHAHAASLDERGLDEFEAILRMETVDVYNWVTGRDAVPPEVDNDTFRHLREYAKTSPIGKADPRRYAEIKTAMTN